MSEHASLNSINTRLSLKTNVIIAHMNGRSADTPCYYLIVPLIRTDTAVSSDCTFTPPCVRVFRCVYRSVSVTDRVLNTAQRLTGRAGRAYDRLQWSWFI